MAGIPDRDPHQKPIELGFGQRIRPFVLDRVLRREHDEGPLQHVRMAVGRHLLLLHRLQERGLRLRWGPVDLVGEKEVRKDWARLEAEHGVFLVVDCRPRDVGGHEIGRELDAREPHRADTRDRPRDERLRKAGKILDQDMSVGEQPHQHQFGLCPFADHSTLDLVEYLRGERLHVTDTESHLDRLQPIDDRTELVSAAATATGSANGRLTIGADELPCLRSE